MMKVAMIARSTLFTSPGGDTIQVQQTARTIQEQGIVAHIRLSDERIDYNEYDLMHFFNIIRPADILHHVALTRIPFVVSTIFIDYSEFDSRHRKGIARLLFSLLGADSIEYIKSIARWLKRSDRIVSKGYFWKGQKRSIREIIRKTSLLLPNSLAEYKSLEKKYKCRKRFSVVPNGVDPELFKFDDKVEKQSNLVLCVARIEGLKNQINLIRALNNTTYHLVIVGASSPNQQSYFDACRRIAAENVSFAGPVSQQTLVLYYQRAKVHVLPSWFESTGLSSLESAIMGCSVVITRKGFAHEYFRDDAVYCDPSSPQSIYESVQTAASLPLNKALQSRIASLYTWQQAGISTAQGYKRVIHGS